MLRDTCLFKSLMLLAIGCALIATTDRDSAAAVERQRHGYARATIKERQAADKPYFVDFRSRPGYLFGHTFILYGRLDARGRARASRYAGIYPVNGQLGLIIGTVIPVPASVRGVEGDVREPATNVYRRRLTAAQYERLKAAVRHEARSERYWNLLTYNCNDFAINIASALNLHTPFSMLLPASFVAELRTMNSR